MSHLCSSHSKAPRAARAFSVVELLVVVAIIAILAALLLPVLAQARERGRRAACLSNLKQIGLGLEMYVNDADGYYPNTFFGSPFPGQYRWMDTLQPYIKSEQIFVCPDASELLYKTRGAQYGGYAYNGAYYSRPDPDQATPPCSKWDKGYGVKNSDVIVPATTIWVTDAAGNYEISWSETALPAMNSTVPRTFGPFGLANMLVERHQNFIDILWCDGHAKAQSLDQVVRLNGAGLARAFTIQDD